MSNINKEEELYCICRKEYEEGEFMIECGKCNGWFHGSCIGIEEYQAQDIDVYHCPECQKEHGPLILKKRRNVSRHNYREIHEGTKQISTGTVIFIRQLKARKFAKGEDIVMQIPDGRSFTCEFLQKFNFTRPILILDKEGLSMKVPPTRFTVFDVEQHVGSMFDLHVIDVSRQEDLRMKMREWTEYYNSPVRGKVLNVISLEFSNTSLSELVEPPEFVKNISWVANAWPKTPHPDSPHTSPVVAKYCLMSVRDCYTDFHVDFGGTSVWYHVLRGEKIFYLIEPTDENLNKYGKWVASSDQGQVFFGEKVDKCYKIVVEQGNTFMIPTGWIHAVLTPKDSLVFGGNFLHSFNIPLQLKIYSLEKSLNTPLKFLFPNFETTNWYAARVILKKVKEIHSYGVRMPSFLRQGIQELVLALKMWTSKKDEFVKFHKLQVPLEINTSKLIKNLEKELKVDSKISPENKFPTSKLPCPAVLSAKAKTVIKLRLSKSNDGDNNEKHEKKSSKKSKLGKEAINKIRLQLNNPEIISSESEHGEESEIEETNVEVDTMDCQIDEKPSMGSKIKLKFSLPSEKRHSSAELIGDIFDRGNTSPSPTHSKSTTPFDIKAEIEAAKNDIFSGGSLEKSSMFSFKQDNDSKETKEENTDDDDDNDDDNDDDEINNGYVIDTLPKPKPKTKRKRTNSENDSDYDPTDDAYYQDAEFVYPRIDVTSELRSDDFVWRPGQRARPKTIGQKRKSSTQEEKPKSLVSTHDALGERLEGKSSKISSIDTKPVIAKKDKTKKGSVKQRLGKLLKLDKTGTRYVRR